MGLLFLPINATNTLECAHCFSHTMLPIPMHGPIIAAKKMLPMATNGPSVSTKKPRNAANTLAWAHYHCQKNCCRWPQMGPVFLPRNAADTLAWAHYCCQKNAADGHKWAQCFYQETKKCCRYP